MTPTSDNSSPTPLHEPIDAGLDATVKEGVQESSGPEARETPQGKGSAGDGPSTAPYVRIVNGDEGKRSSLGGGDARASGYNDDDDLCAPDARAYQDANGEAR